MSKGKDTEIKTIYDDLSVDELKEALKNIFFYAGEFTDSDMEEMNKILAVLERKEPTSPMYSAEESWKRFQETYSDELSALGVHNSEEVMQEKASAGSETVVSITEASMVRLVRRRKLLRIGLVAAIMVVIILAAAVTASAFGYNLFGWVPKWNNDVLGFGEDESPAPNELHDTYKIPAALKELGIEEPLYPTWLPAGFKIDVSVIEKDPIFMHEGYSDGERYLTITIEPLSQTGIISFQKDEQNPMEYIANNRSYFIFADNSCYTATWQTENYSVYVMGEITLDEMKRIIDSVNEVKK